MDICSGSDGNHNAKSTEADSSWLVFWPRTELSFGQHPAREDLVKSELIVSNRVPVNEHGEQPSICLKVKAPERTAETVSASPPCCVLLPRQSRRINFYAKKTSAEVFKGFDGHGCQIKVFDFDGLKMMASKNQLKLYVLG